MRFKLPRENVYTCHLCGVMQVTVDVDEGVTPFMVPCSTKECMGPRTSAFYPRAPRPPSLPAPTHEWYKPAQEEISKLSDGNREHVLKGGLLLRKRTDREPVYHKGEWDDEYNIFIAESDAAAASANERGATGSDLPTIH